MSMLNQRGQAALRCLLLVLASALPVVGQAHVDWTRINDVDPEVLGLYHLNENNTTTGQVLAVPAAMPQGRGLVVAAPVPSTAPGATPSNDVPEPIFGSGSLKLASVQTFDSSDTLSGLNGDLTVEFWLKWDPLMTSSSVQIGLRSGARLRISRDTANPANDQFGVAATHGDFRSAPGFTDWATVGLEEAPIGEWLHMALAIHGTGIHLDPVSAHDVYSTGSVARVYLNGHAVGSFPHALDVTGLKVHDASKLQIQVIGGTGGVLVDEVTIWKKDWSNNGAVANPFAEGRGSGTFTSAIQDWNLYDDRRDGLR